jgi:uncharacterized protein (DUF2147 family)
MKSHNAAYSALIVLATIALPVSALASAASVNGRWVTQSKDAIVEIGACGATVCGRIAKFLVTPPGGVDQKDVNNKDTKLRTRKILGMAVVYNLKASGTGWSGTIYDPKSGKTYRSVVTLLKNGNLSVKGCIGPFCQGQTWTPSK